MSAHTPARHLVACGLACVVFAFLDARPFVDRAGRAFASEPPPGVAQPAAWKSVRLGTRRGVNAYRNALAAAAVRIGDSADEILGRPAFSYVAGETSVDVVRLVPAMLGFATEAPSLSALYARATHVGLALCPAEVGLQLRLDYADQPARELLHVAMKPVATYRGKLVILVLANLGTGPVLIGSDGSTEFIVPRDFELVFCLPVGDHSVAQRPQ
jgi:hypothetical protein